MNQSKSLQKKYVVNIEVWNIGVTPIFETALSGGTTYLSLLGTKWIDRPTPTVKTHACSFFCLPQAY